MGRLQVSSPRAVLCAWPGQQPFSQFFWASTFFSVFVICLASLLPFHKFSFYIKVKPCEIPKSSFPKEVGPSIMGVAFLPVPTRYRCFWHVDGPHDSCSQWAHGPEDLAGRHPAWFLIQTPLFPQCNSGKLLPLSRPWFYEKYNEIK